MRSVLEATWLEVKYAVLYFVAVIFIHLTDQWSGIQAGWLNVLIYVMLILLGARLFVNIKRKRKEEG